MTKPSEPKIRHLALADIEVAERRLRPVSEAGVQGLIASIEQLGMIKDAIHVRKMRRASGERLVLMAGGHRLEAARRLGWETIPARVWADVTDDFARLMEIDDNLSAAELTCLEMSVILAERKRIYERLHPEAKHGAHGGRGGKKNETEIISFSKSVAEKRDLSARHIRNLVRIGSALSPDEIAVLYAAKNPIKFKDLMALSQLDPTQRRLCASAIAQGALASVRDWRIAMGDLAQKPGPDNPRDAWMGRMLQLWSAGQKSWRAEFLTLIGGG